jgi:predicted N-acetyltransferase YhbS
VEYQVRAAKITDIDRLVAISGTSLRATGQSGSLDAGDLLRQLVYLPHASVFVAEARRELAGAAVLTLRPSVVAGGYVGTLDFISVAPSHDPDRVTDALLEEALRSASNKGCSSVEVLQPEDPDETVRLERSGFVPSGTLLRRPVPAAGAASRPV